MALVWKHGGICRHIALRPRSLSMWRALIALVPWPLLSYRKSWRGNQGGMLPGHPGVAWPGLDFLLNPSVHHHFHRTLPHYFAPTW